MKIHFIYFYYLANINSSATTTATIVRISNESATQPVALRLRQSCLIVALREMMKNIKA